MEDQADPREGWPIDEIIDKAPPAKNDMYGSLFFYLQDVLGLFCRRMGRLKVSIQLFQVDARKLPSIIKRDGMDQCSFDRIEVRSPKLVSCFAYILVSLGYCPRKAPERCSILWLLR